MPTTRCLTCDGSVPGAQEAAGAIGLLIIVVLIFYWRMQVYYRASSSLSLLDAARVGDRTRFGGDFDYGTVVEDRVDTASDPVKRRWDPAVRDDDLS
jgi:hypothetical protein